MFAWFEFSNFDIFLFAIAISILRSRYLVAFSVSMFKSCIYSFVRFSIAQLNPNSSILFNKCALYNHSLGICFLSYKNFRSWFKQYKLPVQYTLTQVASYASPGRDPVDHILSQMIVHTIQNI